ncbi:MAG: GreA/GreB family elongation factor [Methylotenera sp.]|nr:GreA/GreB family elongation factor [Methylotenera sp.]
MSRAFVKENDLEHAGIDIPERPVSNEANYVTPTGLKQLEADADKLEQQRTGLKKLQGSKPEQALVSEDPQIRQKIAVIDRDLRFIAARLGSAILVDNAAHSPEAVLFGANVLVEDEDGTEHAYTIVGEDEADIANNKVSYLSPIAKALIGRKVGDTVEWPRPIGNIQLTIIQIKF